MMKSLLEKYIDAFRSRRNVALADAEPLLDAMITSEDESVLARLFEAWDQKGIAEDEIYGIARVMRDRCIKINTRHETFVDIVGTGGSRSKTFNVSTAAAFVVAGAGVPVAKHGNKAATSNSGSADVLTELGVEPAVDRDTAERCLNEIGICFMFAPNFHRLSPTLARVRRGLGFPTIFNCVGPLCNPAGAPHQLIGVWSEDLVHKMAHALARLGTGRSWIVHGRDGLDEISLSDSTCVAEVAAGSVKSFDISPSDHDLSTALNDGMSVTSPAESAAIVRGVLSGDLHGAPQSITLLNAAAALFITGRAKDLVAGVGSALESIDGGNATRKLGQLAEAVQR